MKALLAICGAALVGGILFCGCSHTPFEKCLRDKIVSHVDMRVQAALACSGDETCLINQGVADVEALREDVRECKAAALDGGSQ